MSNIYYTYKVDKNCFFENLIEFLQEKERKTKEENNILSLIRGGKCFIEPLIPKRPIKPNPPMPDYLTKFHFSAPLLIDPYKSERNSYQNKLNSYKTEDSIYKKKLDFYNQYQEHSLRLDVTIIFSILNNPKINKRTEEQLIDICNQVIPADTGYFINNVKFKRLFKEKNNSEMKLDIDSISAELSEGISEILPDDIKEKGKEMAEVYLYLYCVENSLRLFIENVAKNEFGDNYFDQLSGNTSINKRVEGRKRNENKNKWLGVRGDSDLFYLDFEDLNKIITNNWDIFKPYFHDLSWITTKIKEMADCRHLVAHNSFVDDHGRTVIKTNYISILKQLNEVLSE